MKIGIVLLIISCFCSCGLKKVTKVSVKNNNTYAICIMLKANNIKQLVGPV